MDHLEKLAKRLYNGARHKTRAAAAVELGATGDLRAVQPLLMGIAARQRESVLVECIRSLGHLHSPLALPVIQRWADYSGELGDAAREAIVAIEASLDTVPLLECLAEQDGAPRLFAVQRLCTLLGVHAVEPICRSHSVGHKDVVGPDAWALTELGPDAAPALVSLLEADEEGVRLVAGKALAFLGDPRAGVDALIGAIPNPAAAAALRTLDPAESVPALSDVIKEAVHHGRRSSLSAARALQQIDPDRTNGLLVDALRSPEGYQRLAALTLLADLGPRLGERPVAAIARLSGDDHGGVRKAVVETLSRWPESEAAADCLICLLQDPSPEVALAAHQALLRSRALAAVAYLCDALLASNATISNEVSFALSDRDPRLLSAATAAIYDGREVDVRARQRFRRMHSKSSQLTHPRDDLALAWIVVSRPGLAAYVEGLDATPGPVISKLAELLSVESLNEALASVHPQARLLAARILAQLEEDASHAAVKAGPGGSPARDGLSRETAVVVGSVAEEYRWIDEHYPGYKAVWQEFGDVIHIRNDEGDELDLFFDIWSFFGRRESGS